MAEENKSPRWTNPSLNVSTDNNMIEANQKEIDELKNEIQFLKDKLSEVTGEEVTFTEDTTKKEEVVVDLPFDSPFTESVSDTVEDNEEQKETSDILETVKEEVKEEPVQEETETKTLTFDELLAYDNNKEKLSVVVNRYNNDLVASTKGKGAKFVSLSDSEHAKLISGKINEIN